MTDFIMASYVMAKVVSY